MKNFLCMLLLCVSGYVHSLSLPSTVFVLDSDQNFASRPFSNDGLQTQLYQIKVYKVNSPGLDEEITPIVDGEVLYAPLSIVLEGGASDLFKLYYRGPNDNKERYYRIVISEQAFGAVENDTNKNKSIKFINNSLALNTYVVVKPRQEKREYVFDEDKQYFKNTGNTYIRLLLKGSCEMRSNGKEADSHDDVWDVLPGQSVHSDKLKKGFEKYIVTKKYYETIGSGC